MTPVELSGSTVDSLPEGVAGRLVLIDPDEKQAPAALNLFDLGDDPAQVADQRGGPVQAASRQRQAIDQRSGARGHRSGPVRQHGNP